MKKFISILLLLFAINFQAQNEDEPILWNTSVEKISDKGLGKAINDRLQRASRY